MVLPEFPMTKKPIRLVAALLGIAANLMPMAAQAEQMVWQFKSTYRYAVEFQLYAQGRNNIWPGSARVYTLKDSKPYRYPITCNRGDYICYGAWSAGKSTTYWGVGRGNQHKCKDCCYTCGNANPPLKTLTP
jgi:hypothetical protein